MEELINRLTLEADELQTLYLGQETPDELAAQVDKITSTVADIQEELEEG